VTKPTVSSAAGLEIGNTSGDRDQIYCRLLVGDELDVGIDYRFPARGSGRSESLHRSSP
jgi:hypothetical protein